MALAIRPDIDFSSRLSALRAVCEDLGLPANQVPDQSAANSPRTYLKYINFCRAALSLPLFTSMDYTAFQPALNAIAAAAGTAKPENTSAPFASSNATPPVQGSVLNSTQGIWLNASGATYAYQREKKGATNIGTNRALTIHFAGGRRGLGDRVPSCRCAPDNNSRGEHSPPTSNPVTVP